MLDKIDLNELSQNEQSQASQPSERLQLVTEHIIDQLPLPQRMLANSYLNSYRQSGSFEDVNGDIIDALNKIKEVIEFIQYGSLEA